ncbi:nuclear transport factor 2 family protein [Rhodococcus sp. CSLK01-03]|uniref:Nuclear transport factor 2 family protein n=1 Tax=Rhodococcus indonesiensis TaxID=3055869 RepID=A0ABT7RJT1_9NOCA|nr:nuclear transport factor 2 family protein [Rhodococcus indonesiensis]MDM7487895.1 nuclear transport factor 2 family protein [Rhodococcus indonesiensis]
MSSPFEDRLELADVVARYARAVDRREPAVLRSLFTDDAEFVQPRGLVRRGQDPVLTGAGPIADSVLAAVAHLHSTRHVLGQHVVDLDGDRARGELYCEAHHVYPSGEGYRDYAVSVRYRDEYRRGPGGWRISRRELVVDLTADREVSLLRSE